MWTSCPTVKIVPYSLNSLHMTDMPQAACRRDCLAQQRTGLFNIAFEARRTAPLRGCRHANCANCLRYAAAWREGTLARLNVMQMHLQVAV